MQRTSELSSKTYSCKKHELRCIDLNVMTEDNYEDDDKSLNIKNI